MNKFFVFSKKIKKIKKSVTMVTDHAHKDKLPI